MCRCLMDKELLILRFFFWRATLSSVFITTTQTQDYTTVTSTLETAKLVSCVLSAPPLVLCSSSVTPHSLLPRRSTQVYLV